MAPHTPAPSVLIRAARGSDGPALARLADLDSSRLPAGELLVGVQDGELVAALAPGTGDHVADPFRRTAGVLDLLAVHAARRNAPARPALRQRLRLAHAA